MVDKTSIGAAAGLRLGGDLVWCSRAAVDALRLKSHERLPGHFTVAVKTGLLGM
jgi:hypothetical protein